MKEPLEEKRSDFAKYGCGGFGEYARCEEMSEDYALLVSHLAAERERAYFWQGVAEGEKRDADREKARADALEEVIAKVRVLADECAVVPRRFGAASAGAVLVGRKLAALLPDDTKEVERPSCGYCAGVGPCCRDTKKPEVCAACGTEKNDEATGWARTDALWCPKHRWLA